MITYEETTEQTFLLTNELLFTKIFTTPENEKYVKYFLEDVLDIQLTTVKPEEEYNFQTFKQQFKKLREDGIWLPVIDIMFKLEKGSWIVLDLQKFPRNRFIQQITANIAGGFHQKYQQESCLKENEFPETREKFHSIRYLSLLDFNFFKQDSRVLYQFNFLDKDTKMPLKDGLMELHFFELKKPIKQHYAYAREQKKKYWQDLFTKGTVSEEAPTYFKEISTLLKESSLTIEEAELAKKLTQSQEEFTEILQLINANKAQLLRK